MNIFTRLILARLRRSATFLKTLMTGWPSPLPLISYQNLEQLIEQGYERNVDVYSVVNWISEQASGIPLLVQRWDGEKWVNDEENPLQKLLNHPNPYQNGREFRHEFYTFYMMTGNAFAYAPRIDAGQNVGKTQEMWVMPSQHTEIVTGGWLDPVTGYKVELGREKKTLPFFHVGHMRTPNLDYLEGRQLWGMPPLRAGLLTLDRSNSNSQAAMTSFKTMGMSGILQVEDDPYAATLTDEQQQKEEARLDENYMGVFNAGKTMVTNRKHTYTRLGLSPVDMNLLADKKATLRDICNIFNVSSVLFNDNENSTYNNVSEAKKSAYSEAVLPLNEHFIEMLEKWLLPAYGDDIRVIQDLSNVSVLQADKKQQSEWVSNLVDRGIITRNEGREFIGLETSNQAEMNQFTINAGQIPIEDVNLDVMAPNANEVKMIGEHYLNK